MTPHLLEKKELDAKGFLWAFCTCGWGVGPAPDEETLMDALMEHAAFEASRGG